MVGMSAVAEKPSLPHLDQELRLPAQRVDDEGVGELRIPLSGCPSVLILESAATAKPGLPRAAGDGTIRLMVRLLPFLILLGPAKGTGLSPAPPSFESATREVDYEVDCSECGELTAETVSSSAGAHSRAVGIDPATGWRQSVSHTITAAGQTFTASRSFTRAPLGRIGAIGFGADGEVDFQHHPRLRAVTGWDLRDDTGTPLLSRRQLLDGLDRLEHIVFSDGQGAEIGRLSYERDERSGRVARKTLLDGRFWTYGYDPDTGALTNAQLHAADGSPDPAHAHSYGYDAMGNRVGRGGFTGVRTFGANADNQPTGPLRLEPELVSGWIEPVPGLSNLTIRVDGREAARSPGGGFHYLLDPPTNSAAHLQTVRVTAHRVINGQTSSSQESLLARKGMRLTKLSLKGLR